MKKGITSVETIASVAVISIIVLSFYLTMVLGIQFQRKARMVTTATTEGEREIELIRNTKFQDLVDGQATTSLSLLPSGQKSVNISSVETNLKQITVTITWQSGGSSKSVTLNTLAAAGGLNDLSK